MLGLLIIAFATAIVAILGAAGVMLVCVFLMMRRLDAMIEQMTQLLNIVAQLVAVVEGANVLRPDEQTDEPS